MAKTSPPKPLTAAQAAYANEIMRLLRGGEKANALAKAKQLAADAAGTADAQQLLGVCHSELGETGATVAAFERALELAPAQPVILFNYAASLRKLGQEEATLVCLQRAVAAQPSYAAAWTELGESALRLNQPGLAVSALRRAVELHANAATAWHSYGNALRANQQLDAAEAAFRRALELSPQASVSWVNLGAVLRLRGRSDQAVACFQRARDLGHRSPELDDALVGAWLDVGKPEQSLALARHVVREFPAFVPGQVTLAQLLWEYGGSLAPDEDALAAFRKATAEQPGHVELQAAFAQFLLAAKQTDEALHYIRHLRRSADCSNFARLQANALQEAGQVEAADQLYATLYSQLRQPDSGFLSDYARHLLTAGKLDSAVERALEATRIDPLNQTAWAYLSTAWRMLDDPREHWLCDYDALITLLDVEPPPDSANSTAFVHELLQSIEPLHLATREPVQQSLRGGSQTPGRLFGRDSAILAATQQTLLRSVNGWLAKLEVDRTHPFRSRLGSGAQICGSWSVKLWSAGKHANHIHPQGWISSAFYLALPASVTDPINGEAQAGHIQFGQPPVELGLGLSPRRVIRPQTGKLALFPSYMWHGTVPFADLDPRITIAFDMTPEQP
ncbi:MAG: tetratricopeptide repeat protein [Pseudomarimonas sp.]